MAIPLAPLGGQGDPTQQPYATPQNYMSPEAIKAQRDYANALMLRDQGKDGRQFPVVQSWTQGVSNMVNALMGGMAQHNAQMSENSANDLAGKRTTMPVPGTQPTSFSEGPSSEGHDTASGGDVGPAGNAIASVESKGSGDYSAVGPTTKRGDRAYGRYQVMGANVPVWTQEVLGKSMTPQEFLHNPQAQDAVFKVKFAQGGDNDADRASVWFTGKPYAQGKDRSDGYITGAQYVDRFAKAMPKGGAQTAMAFAGPDGGAAPAGVQAITTALRGGTPNTQVAKGPAPLYQTPLPAPQAGQSPYVLSPPALPQMSPAQMQGIMSDPRIPWAEKMQFQSLYLNQRQPQVVPVPGGNVRIGADGQQQLIPDLQKGTAKIGDVEVPSYSTVTPQPGGGLQSNPIQQAPVPSIGPRSEAAPLAAPAAAGPAEGGPAAPAGPASTVAENAPVAPAAPAAAPETAPAAPAEAAPGKPVQVASANPQEAFAAAAGKPKDVTPAEAASPLSKLAQNDEAIRRLVGPQVYEAYTQKKDADNARELKQKQGEAAIEVEKNGQEKNNELNAKRYTDIQEGGVSAIRAQHNLGIASTMLQDKKFYSGWASGVAENVKRLSAALGIDPSAAEPMEVFRKTMASAIANGLKSAYGGLGQIRNKEIELQEKANGSLSTSPAANRALIEISKRNAAEMANISEIATEYRLGNEVTDPITGKVLAPANVGPDGQQHQRVGLDPGYDKIARQYLIDHPTFSPTELADFNRAIDEANGVPTQGKTTEKAGTEAAPTVGTEKQFKQGVGVWDGKQWVPKK